VSYIRRLKVIAQRELRNHTGEVLRRAEQGEELVISVDGRPVAILGPYRKRRRATRAEGRTDARGGPFSLFGSTKLNGPVDEVLGEVRHDAQAALDGKLAATAGERAKQTAPAPCVIGAAART